MTSTEPMTPEAMTAEFRAAFDTPKDPELWLKLVEEETTEVEQAAAELLKELCDVRYVLFGYLDVTGAKRDADLPPGHAEKLKALSDRLDHVDDLMWDAFQGVGDEAFARVHASTMSKLGDGGKPVRREDGKVLKGPNYQPPVLLDLITGEGSDG